MSETTAFLEEMLPRLQAIETALHNGDVAPRKAVWSRQEPLTLFGAARSGIGWAQIEPVFDWLGESFSDCTAYGNEVIAAGASGDLAYTVAFEHTTASMNGAAPQSYTLRVTTVFRREDGEWKVVHRHGDALAGQHAESLADSVGGNATA